MQHYKHHRNLASSLKLNSLLSIVYVQLEGNIMLNTFLYAPLRCKEDNVSYNETERLGALLGRFAAMLLH